MAALKTSIRQDTNFVVIGRGGCHNDNLRCREWHKKMRRFFMDTVFLY